MPADADSLAALGDLASTSGRPVDPTAAVDDQVTVAVPVARPRRHLPRPGVAALLASAPVLRSPSSVPAFAAVRALPRRTRLGALAVTSVAAGLLAGLVVPVASAAPVPAGSSSGANASARSTAATPAPQRIATTRTARAATAKPVSPSKAARPASTVRTAAATPTGATLAAALPALAAPSVVDWSAASRTAVGARPAAAPPARRSVGREAAPARPTAATIAAARAYKPTKRLPGDSGEGRRIVYSQHRGHVWVVGVDGRVVRDYPVTGRIGRPSPGSYRVFSKSPTAVNPTAKVRFDLMVRFAHGITGAAIGFHTIPRWYDGRPIQRENQLGQMIGAGGCVRQSAADARWLYRWSRVGERVVVLP